MRPAIPDEQAPHSTDGRLRDYLARMFRACRLVTDNLYRWTVEHTAAHNPHGMMKWMGAWLDKPYQRGDVVLDAGWTMIANKDTTTKAAPTAIGDPEQDQPDTPAYATANYQGVVWSGTNYTFTEAGWLNALQVWVPALTDDTNYRIIIMRYDTDPPTITTIEEPVLTLNDWTTVAVNQTPIPVGTELLIVLDALNSGSETPVTGGWEYSGSTNTGTPAIGNWNNFQTNTKLRVNYTDLDSTNRQSELMSMGAGTTVTFAETADSRYSVSYYINTSPTDQGDHAEWLDFTQTDVGTQGTPRSGNTCTMTALVPIPLPTDYSQAVGYWSGNQPTWATAEGYLRLGDTLQTVPNNAYGVRVSFQRASISPDWDVVAYSEVLGGTTQGAVGGIDSWKPGEPPPFWWPQ